MEFIIGFFISAVLATIVEWRMSTRFHHSILTFCWLGASLFGFVVSLVIAGVAKLLSLS